MTDRYYALIDPRSPRAIQWQLMLGTDCVDGDYTRKCDRCQECRPVRLLVVVGVSPDQDRKTWLCRKCCKDMM